MKTRVTLKYFVSHILWKHFSGSNLPQTPSNLISLKILVALRPWTLFSPKIRAIKWQKSPKIILSWLLFFRIFHSGWNLVLKQFQVCFRMLFRKKKKILVEIWLLLTNLVVNKNTISKRKFDRQSVSEHF